MASQYLHKPNLNDSTRKPNVIWNSQKLPIPIDLFDTNSSLRGRFTNRQFSFWLTVSPNLSSESIARILRHGCVETIRISSSKYKNEKDIRNEIRRINEIIGTREISLALDLSGPKVRISKLELLSGQGTLDVFQGDTIALIPESKWNFIKDKRLENIKVVPYKETIPLKKDGKFLFISDGWNQFEIMSHDEIATYCKALHDCILFNSRGVDIAGMYDDIEDIPDDSVNLINALQSSGTLDHFEWLCLSFCNNKSNVEAIRKLSLPNTIKLMSKIETQQGLDNLDEICGVSEGVMVARGDLAVQLAAHKRDILETEDSIRLASKKFNKKCVIATRVGDSLDGVKTSLNNEEIYRLKHELLFDQVSCWMLANEILEDETSYQNFLIIMKAIDDIFRENDNH